MYQALVNLFMLRLRTILLYDKLYYFIFFIALIIALILFYCFPKPSKYNGDEKTLYGYILIKKLDGDKLTIELKGKEKVIVNIYLKKEIEKEYIENNYHLGDYIKITGELVKPSNNTIFNLFNYKRYLKSKNIYWLFNAESIEKIKDNTKILYSIKEKIYKRIDNIKYSGSYIRMLLLGDTSYVDSNMLDSYKINGISHLFAVSGMHVSILSMVILFILKKLKLSETKRYIIVSFFLLFFLFLTNYMPGVSRAVLFFILLSINKIYYFHVKPINVLLLTVSFLLIIEKGYMFDLGFQLSSVISFYLLLSQKIISKYHQYFIKLLVVSLIAFISSMPIIIYNFFELNLLSPLINLIFVPFVSFIIFPFSFVTFLFPIFDNVFFFLIKILEDLSKIISKIDFLKIIIPKPNIVFIFLYYLIITYLLLTLNKRSIILLTLLLIINYNLPLLNIYGYMIMIDVGQGDSILISYPYSKTNILIDTGGKETYYKEQWKKRVKEYSLGKDRIIPLLKSLGIRKLDYLIITHGDFDHMGEANNILNHYKVQKVLLNKGKINNNEKVLINYIKKNNIKYNVVTANNILLNNSLYIIHSKMYSNENDNSIIIYLNINNHRILLIGDISRYVENDLVNNYQLNNIDVLKVAHHGSNTSTGLLFLNEINPKYAFISVGKKNKFNHPNKEVLDRLKDKNIKTNITSIHGSIKYIFDKNGTILICPP